MQFFAPRGTYAQGERPYDIFKDRMAAISSIAGAIKTKIANNYWDQLNKTYISELHKKISKDEEIKKLNIYKSEPPKNIYPQNTEQVAGQYVDYTLGKMLGTQQAIGRLMPPQEVRMPKIDKQKLLDYVRSGGKMDWENILKVIEERPSFLGEYSDLERTAMSGAMGRDVMGELETGIGRAGSISDYFTPKEEKRPGKYPYTEQEVKEYEMWKESQKPPETQIDFDKLNEFIEANNMKLSGVNVNPTTGNLSYSFSAKDTDLTWEEFLVKANKYIKDNPDYEITSTNPKTGSVTISKIRPEKEAEETKSMYDTALTGSEDYFGIEDWVYINKKGFVQDEEQYRLLYAEYEKGAKEIYEKTGELKPKEYLSLEEAGKYTLPTLGEGAMGGYKPVLNTEDIPWSWLSEEGKETERETPKEAKEKEDEFGYIIGAVYKNAEGKLLKYLGNDEWEEINPSVEGKTRGIK